MQTIIRVINRRHFSTLITDLTRLDRRVRTRLRINQTSRLANEFVGMVFQNSFANGVFGQGFSVLSVIFFRLTGVAHNSATTFFGMSFTVHFSVRKDNFAARALQRRLRLRLIITSFRSCFLGRRVRSLLHNMIRHARGSNHERFATAIGASRRIILQVRFRIRPKAAMEGSTHIVRRFAKKINFALIKIGRST